MKILKTITRVPGGLMVVPLMLGALLNTVDQAHLPAIEGVVRAMGAAPTAEGHYEFLRVGGFVEALFKTGALTLIGLFLFCAAAQMNLRVAGRAMKKGLLLTFAKYAVGVLVGYLSGLYFDPMQGPLGLSAMAIVAAMTNSNGGMYAALTGEYGNRSDVGAIAVLSLNDGPFLTLLFLGFTGSSFPVIAFLAVLMPIALGMLLGNLDEDIRRFLQPGEHVTIPFFAFALGAGMDFMSFFDPAVVGAGLTLGLLTTVLTGAGGILVLKLSGEKSQVAGVAEASTAGNAAATPAAVAAAAFLAGQAGTMSVEQARAWQDLVPLATAQISISTLTTALLCPLAVIFWSRYQQSKGIDSTRDDI